MRNFATIIGAVITAANNNPDGFTLDLDTFTFASSGYAVALAETQNSFGHEGLNAVVNYCIKNNVRYIGGWYNAKNGQFYYDATVVLSDRSQAIEVGRMNRQIAIFDLDNLEEIEL